MEDKNKSREKMRKMVLAGDIGNVKNVAVTLRGKYRNGEDIRYYSLLDLGYKGKNLLLVGVDDFGGKGSKGCETLERSLSLFVYEFMMAGNRDDTFYDDVMESLSDKKMCGKIYTCGVITSYSEGIDVSGFTKYKTSSIIGTLDDIRQASTGTGYISPPKELKVQKKSEKNIECDACHDRVDKSTITVFNGPKIYGNICFNCVAKATEDNRQ